MSVRVVVHANAAEEVLNSSGVADLVGRMLEAGLEAAHRFVPVDTGALDASLGIEQDGPKGKLFAGTDYDIFVEIGTSKMAAQPYMRPSVDAMLGAAG